MRQLAACLVAVWASAGLAAEEPAPADPAQVRPAPARVAEEGDWGLGVYATVSAGSSNRIANGVLRHREDGDVIDGGGGLVVLWEGEGLVDARSIGRFTAAFTAGTDAAAGESGQGLYAGDVALREFRGSRHGWQAGLLAIEVEAGYSEERKALLGGEIFAYGLHLAAAREEGVKTYRIGVGHFARLERRAAMQVAIDRLIMYPDAEGEDADRELATEASIGLGWTPMRHVLVFGNASYVHDALGTDDEDVWTGSVGLGLML